MLIIIKSKNELKIYMIYICDFGIDISITRVCVLMEESSFEFQETYKLDFRGHFGENSKSYQ